MPVERKRQEKKPPKRLQSGSLTQLVNFDALVGKHKVLSSSKSLLDQGFKCPVCGYKMQDSITYRDHVKRHEQFMSKRKGSMSFEYLAAYYELALSQAELPGNVATYTDVPITDAEIRLRRDEARVTILKELGVSESG
ncbi:C2H2 type zinc-finger (2 copies) [Carpediemonas membranifera]|uniref:C2H2 type zinc-finger (2 copies) n=1 Tax=Carpediemonas membranifera TaxID=201153 RepID=A0A8J6AVH1_9EUKA|nr:C2H2 type zinc-finger (2 copies) [Carpediemonas membranifera]|eukprot:KAG9392610.1 C2H2 type zinc-finger (2 copies) [Carpediemonas membranifera]